MNQEQIIDIYTRNLKKYNLSLHENKIWDYVIITATNEEQKQYYINQIENRKNKKILNKETIYLVVSQYKNKNVGSGGAFLNTLKILKEKFGKDVFKSKILYIQSAGMAQRNAYYSNIGKVFIPIQRKITENVYSDVFDEILINMNQVGVKMSKGILVTCGDVVLINDENELNIDDKDCFALSTEENVIRGTKHGVFGKNNNSYLNRFLHKKSIEVLEKNGAVNNGKINIDTGIIYMNSNILENIYSIFLNKAKKFDINEFEKFVNTDLQLEFYMDFLYPFSKDASIEEFVNETTLKFRDNEIKYCRKKLWNTLHKYNMYINTLKNATFIHFGDSKELLEIKVNKTLKQIGWNETIKNNRITMSEDDLYIQNCEIPNNFKKPKNSILINLKIANGIEIPNDIIMYTNKLKNNKYVTLIYGITDDIKSNRTLFNIVTKINKDENIKSIWDYDLFIPQNTEEEAVKSSIDIYNLFNNRNSKITWNAYMNIPKISIAKTIKYQTIS